MAIARKIGTFREFAGNLECHIVPSHPAIAASTEKVLEDEKNIGIEGLVRECIERTTFYSVKDVTVHLR